MHSGMAIYLLLCSRLKLELFVMGSDGSVVEQLELTELSHLANYSQPHAPGALLKAALVCAEIVDLGSNDSLAAQLTAKFGCGFRIQSMSSLPQGSGKGLSVCPSICPSPPAVHASRAWYK